jgi:Protein of unknown function (DUF3347)
MKTLFITVVAVAALTFSACNGSSTSSRESSAAGGDGAATQPQAAAVETKSDSPLKDVTTAYLQVKNGLANDNGNDAATGGNAFVDALGKVDKSSMNADQKKSFEDIADDAKEMAEHIGKNAGKIEHQREHFDMLSKDMYDLVKTFGTGQSLYQDLCPMYNNNKGATWLSETKEIKNPYMGKKQLTCGSVNEELK